MTDRNLLREGRLVGLSSRYIYSKGLIFMFLENQLLVVYRRVKLNKF